MKPSVASEWIQFYDRCSVISIHVAFICVSSAQVLIRDCHMLHWVDFWDWVALRTEDYPMFLSVITFTAFRVATEYLYHPALSVWFSEAEWYACIPRCGPALHTWAITHVVVLFILAGCCILDMDWWDWTIFHWKVAINPSFLVFLLIQVG
jgi:hypothetical protein